MDQGDRCSEDFIYVKDAVAATLAAARAPRATGRVINVGSGPDWRPSTTCSLCSADLLGTATIPGSPRNRIVIAHAHQRGGCPWPSELLDFTPRVSLIAGLAEVVRWLGEAEQPARYALAPVGTGRVTASMINALTFDLEEYFHAEVFAEVVRPEEWPALGEPSGDRDRSRCSRFSSETACPRPSSSWAGSRSVIRG